MVNCQVVILGTLWRAVPGWRWEGEAEAQLSLLQVVLLLPVAGALLYRLRSKR